MLCCVVKGWIIKHVGEFYKFRGGLVILGAPAVDVQKRRKIIPAVVFGGNECRGLLRVESRSLVPQAQLRLCVQDCP